MRQPRLSLLLLLLLLSPLRLRAWGVDGHRAIGQIAEHHLSGKARREIARLLGTESLTLVSTWPDEVRPYAEYSYTAPWHYVNEPAGLDHAQYLLALRTDTVPNAYNKLLTQLQVLRDPTKPAAVRVMALKFVVHLVGDVHQPLHAGHAADKGGNDIKVKFRGRDTNLHSLWDSGLLDYQGLTYTEMGRQFDDVPRATRRAWQRTAPAQWLWESYQLSSQLYQEADQNPDFTYTYFPRHAPELRQRLQQAGLRLAQVLNEAFA